MLSAGASTNHVILWSIYSDSVYLPKALIEVFAMIIFVYTHPLYNNKNNNNNNDDN